MASSRIASPRIPRGWLKLRATHPSATWTEEVRLDSRPGGDLRESAWSEAVVNQRSDKNLSIHGDGIKGQRAIQDAGRKKSASSLKFSATIKWRWPARIRIQGID